MKYINKTIYYVIIFFFILSYLNAQKNYYKNILTNLKLEQQYILSEEINSDDALIVKYIDNDVYIYININHQITTDDMLIIYKTNIKETKKIAFSLPRNERDWVSNFAISNNMLYVLTQYHIYTYNIKYCQGFPFKMQPDEFQPIDDITLGSLNYHDIKVEGAKIVLLESCYSCTNPGIRTAVFNIGGNQIQSHEFNTPKGFQLEHYAPNKRFDFRNGMYITSSILDYNIALYNNNFDTIAVLHRDVEALQKNKEKESMFDSRPYEDWAKENKFSPKIMQTSRMEFTEFLDDTTIFVCYSNWTKGFSDSTYIYDIWRCNSLNNSWTLYKKDLTNISTNLDDLMLPEYLSGGLLNSYHTSNGKIIKVNSVPFDLSKTDFSKMSYKEFYNKCKEYYEKNELLFSVFIYTLK